MSFRSTLESGDSILSGDFLESVSDSCYECVWFLRCDQVRARAECLYWDLSLADKKTRARWEMTRITKSWSLCLWCLLRDRSVSLMTACCDVDDVAKVWWWSQNSLTEVRRPQGPALVWAPLSVSSHRDPAPALASLGRRWLWPRPGTSAWSESGAGSHRQTRGAAGTWSLKGNVIFRSIHFIKILYETFKFLLHNSKHETDKKNLFEINLHTK